MVDIRHIFDSLLRLDCIKKQDDWMIILTNTAENDIKVASFVG